MKATTVEIFRGGGVGGFWYWHATAGNGEIIASSEDYTCKHDATRGALRAFPSARVVYL